MQSKDVAVVDMEVNFNFFAMSSVSEVRVLPYPARE
jgi:hypothetical protein